jgi:hypothetical protein
MAAAQQQVEGLVLWHGNFSVVGGRLISFSEYT